MSRSRFNYPGTGTTHGPKGQEAEPHRRAAEYYEASAKSHRKAAEAHERGDQDAADHHSSEAIQQHQDGERHEERAKKHHAHPPE